MTFSDLYCFLVKHLMLFGFFDVNVIRELQFAMLSLNLTGKDYCYCQLLLFLSVDKTHSCQILASC